MLFGYNNGQLTNEAPMPPGRVLLPTRVQVPGRYSSYSDQGELLQTLLEIAPSGTLEPITPANRQVQRRLRPPEIAELVAGYRAGATIYELAGEFRINRNTVSATLEREGIPL